MTTKYKTITCNSCDVLVINNHICHEAGCPNAWRDEVRQCKWCGSDFSPDYKWSECCCEDCWDSYNTQHTLL